MERQAIITPYSLGTLEAYSTVIRDISRVLEDPIVDMTRLFYAVMVQSGLQGFRIPGGSKVPISSLLLDRTVPISFEKIESKLVQLRSSVFQNARPDLTREQRATIHSLAEFLVELYVAAEFRRPIATCAALPNQQTLQPLLKDDFCIVIGALLGEVQTLSVSAPVAKFNIPAKDFSSFQRVLSSDIFQPYIESHTELEILSKPTNNLFEHIDYSARRVVDAFPVNFELRTTAVNTLRAIPSFIELVGGKLVGTFLGPIFSTIAEAVGHERCLLLYSFEPTWRQVWGGKLDKVRQIVSAERAAKAFLK